MHALRRWRGALLAERVGAGKTWLALAVAARWRRPAVAIVPSILVSQWETAAARAHVPLHCWTHERVSRGTLPPGAARLVIVDEAHRLRHMATRRAATIAPWLVGRPTLLLTATPIVNRIDDLVALLRLVLPDDALALDGVDSLDRLADGPIPSRALRRVVIRSAGVASTIACRDTALHPSAVESARAERAIARIDMLRLSQDRAVRRLLSTVLLDAAASSDAALAHALRRYHALLLAARDAGGGTRRALRGLLGRAQDQLALWSLFDMHDGGELALDDLDVLQRMLPLSRCDRPWIADLLDALPPEIPAVCFARHRATARAIVTQGGDDIAWVVGGVGGIGPHRMPRAQVLAAFGPMRERWEARRHIPRLLVATDVAAEGLDLQAAGCVAHADLPWTAVRLRQREGRFLRPGQRQSFVRSLTRLPAPVLERRLAPRARIARKATIAERWYDALESRATEVGDGDGRAGPLIGEFERTAMAGHEDLDAAALIALSQADREGTRWVVRTIAGAWRADDEAGRTLLAGAIERGPERPTALAAVHATLAEAVRAALASVPHRTQEVATALVLRIQRLARTAARDRDAAALRRLDRVLRFAMTPQTHGGRLLLRALVEAGPEQMSGLVPTVIVERNSVTARPVALLLFPSRTGALR